MKLDSEATETASGYQSPAEGAIVDSGPEIARSKPSAMGFHEMAAAAKAAKRAAWSKMELRQDFADERFMRAILAAAGIRVAERAEPATMPRVRRLLGRAGITPAAARAAVGCSIEQFLAKNANPLPLPLWAALALICESHGVLPLDDAWKVQP